MIEFPKPLVEGVLLRRYKRFLADVRLATGEEVTAHCVNTGSMKTCGSPGDTVMLLHNPSPTRKLAYTWELTRTSKGFIGVNTARPNHVVASAIAAGRIPELQEQTEIKCEVKYGTNSRIDILLTSPNGRRCFVEVKNTTLLVGDEVQFPDAVTERGLKHLQELTKVVEEGDRAVMFYLVNRAEGQLFAPARTIDPEYAKALKKATASGVEALAYRAVHTLKGIDIGESLPVKI